MNKFEILKELVIIFTVSLPILIIFRRLKLSGVVGLLLAGIFIGPFGFKLITRIEAVEVMAEFGVILLLFYIGLEFSIERLIKMKRLLLFAGGFQVFITTLVTAAILKFFSFEFSHALFLGILVALSSTAIVLKIFVDENLLNTPHGQISVAILIFQDIMIVPLFILVPLLGSSGEYETSKIFLKITASFGAAAAILLLSRWLVPKFLDVLTKTRTREIFMMGILFLLFGTALLTEISGLSLSIGAFIAGVILSESDYSHQVISEILPLKDTFNSLFFVSVGMLLNLNFVAMYEIEIAAATFLIFILKASIIFFIVRILNYPWRTAIITGLALSQVGEFSFMLALLGKEFSLIDETLFNAFLSSSIITMTATPFLIKYSESIASIFTGKHQADNSVDETSLKKISGHVVIAGFGLNGRNLANVLRETGTNYIIIEMNPQTVKQFKKEGEKIIFGDSTRTDILQAAQMERAKVFVIAISDKNAALYSLQAAKKINPTIHCIVRTRYVSEVDNLKNHGADEVIPEEFETSLQIFKSVLTKYHVPMNIIMRQINFIRAESYHKLRIETEADAIFNLDEILAAGLTETYFVEAANQFINKNLEQINLRAKTAATIIAIVRDGKTISNPGPTSTLISGDTIVITGTHKAVDDAIAYLNGEINL